MREDSCKRNTTMDLAFELINLNKTVEWQELLIDELALKAAMYKANFFHRYHLADKIGKQIEENCNYRVGDFDGFCYASWRANAVYRTLFDMYTQRLITEEEYRFCEV